MQKRLTQIIADWVLANNPNTFNHAFETLPGQSVTGRIGFYDKPMGLMDTKSNYFYIRFRNDPQVSFPEDRTTSCKELEIEQDMRLVAWVANAIPERLQEVLRHDIITTDFSVLTNTERRQITKLYPIEIEEEIVNTERIVQEETLQEKLKVPNKKFVLHAVDFKLKYNYKPYAYPDLCLDRQICSVC